MLPAKQIHLCLAVTRRTADVDSDESHLEMAFRLIIVLFFLFFRNDSFLLHNRLRDISVLFHNAANHRNAIRFFVTSPE